MVDRMNEKPQEVCEDIIVPANTTNIAVDGCSSIGSCVGRCGTSDSVCSCDHLCGGTVECCCDRDQVCTMTSDGMVNSKVVPTLVNTAPPHQSSSILGYCEQGSQAMYW